MSTKEDVFKGIVKNAIDYFEESIKMVHDKPKYSLINFYSAIELFFKARLIEEHWVFIIDNMNNANIDSFRQGHSKTIGIDNAIERLSNIFNENISNSAKICFKELKKHRNRVIHFYHEDLHDNQSNKDVAEIISEQCRGWYFLYKIINQQWKDYFIDYSDELNMLDEMMKENRNYLEAKYKDLKKEIEGKIEGGKNIINCPSCGFNSFEPTKFLGPKKKFECLVCEMTETVLFIECPDCGEGNIYIRELGKGKCDNCGYEIDMDELINMFTTEDPKEYFMEGGAAYCNFCEFFNDTGQGIVANIKNEDKYLCLNCLEEYETFEIDNCRHCGEKIAGCEDIVETGLIGCVMCDGHREWNC